jgi:peptide/nickel transport system substrate-binding protein
MTKPRGRTVLLCCCCLIAAATAACSSNAPTTQASTGKTLRIGLSQLPDILDPMLANPVTKIDLTPMFDYLVGVNSTETALDPATGVASKWTTTDNQTWTFTIRTGIKFSNGEALSSADVVFSIDRELSTAARSSYAPYLQSVIASVTAPSPTEVKIVLKHPDFEFPYYLSALEGTEGMVVPKQYVQKVGNTGFAANPIGSGPYALSSQVAGQSLTFTARPGVDPIYGRVIYSKIIFTQSADEATRIAALQAGQFDLVDFDPTSESPSSLKNDGFTIFQKPNAYVIQIQLQGQYVAHTLLSSETFREAMALAINYQQINKDIYKGLGHVVGAQDGSNAIGYQPIAPYAYDPAKAKSLLAQSGYHGQTLTVYSFSIAGEPGLGLLSQALAGYWNAIGLKTSILSVDYATYRTKWIGKDLAGQVAPIGLANDHFASQNFSLMFTCNGALTYVCYPSLDNLVASISNDVGSSTKYASSIAPVENYIHDHYLAIPLLEIGAFYAGDSAVRSSWKLGTGEYDINLQGLFSGKA